MKYWIITYGCQMNRADSERIARNLKNKGYKPASNTNEADFIVINMCSVRQSAVNRVYGKIKELRKLKNKKIALAGCVLRRDFKKLIKQVDFFFENKEYLKLPPVSNNKSQALIPISYGCSNYCSYCVVPYARGKLICRPYKKVIKEVKEAIKKETKEIWLLGQNVNDYKDKNINFPKLLKMVSEISGNFLVYFLSANPKDFSDELIDAMAKSEKIAKWINLPIQSGDNKMLKAMNRPYTVNQYKTLVKKIRKKMPNIKLSTDIIVGFPKETKTQFENTKKLAKEIKFDNVFVAKYSPRPQTAAFKLKDDISVEEKKRRWHILNKLINGK